MTSTELTTSKDLIEIVDDNLRLVARNPNEMQRCQTALIDWFAIKIENQKKLVSELKENLDTAKRNKWRHLPLKRQFNLATKRMRFFEKGKIALDNGFYIIPAFPVDVFAIRVKKDTQPWGWRQTSEWGYFKAHFDMPSSELPAGEGQNVSNEPTTRQGSYKKEGKKEGEKIWYSNSDEYQGIDFPMAIVKPHIMTETERALALKVFDQIGVLPAPKRRRSDPMVIGQILPPKTYSHQTPNPLSFLIAWWLDTEVL